ncbi:VOC family protein [Streptomyces sp. NPDC003442]
MSTRPYLAHVVLQTSRLAEMRNWYNTVLEAHTVHEGHGLCFLTFDDEHHRLALIQPPGQLEKKNPAASGMHHTAYTFDHLDSLLARYAELKEQGITPAAPVQHGVTTSLYYRDPDGNFAELQVDNFRTPDEATAYMEGVEYGEDPVGVGFSPDLMITERRGGTPAEELQTRAWALSTTPDLPSPAEALSA